MKRTKIIITLALTLVLALAFGITAFAAGTGTKEDPFEGGNHYPSADGGSIQLHKLDIAAFERNKAAALVADGQLPGDGTVTYTGNTPVGTQVSADEVVGSYTTSADNVNKIDVTLGELAALGNITFRIEQVALGSGKTPGSTNPTDYTPVASGIDSYARTDAAGLISWTGLPHSYYRITEEPNETGLPVGASSYIVSLPMVNPEDAGQTLNTVHLYPKNRAVG